MKKRIIIIIFIFVISQNSEAQKQTDLNGFFSKIKSDLKNIYPNKDSIFFNYGFVFQNDLEEWNTHKTIIANTNKWFGIYNAVNMSVINGTLNLPPDSIIKNSQKTYKKNETDLGLLFFKGDYLSVSQQENVLVKNSKPKFNKLAIFSGACFKNKFYDNNITFHYKPDFLFSNSKEIKDIYINFGNNTGYKKIFDINKKQSINIFYKYTGEKSITYKIITSKDTLISYSKINILFNENKIEPTYKCSFGFKDSVSLFNNLKSVKVDIPPAGSYYAGLISLDYYYYEGCDGIFNKPVIITEGFDILGNMDLDFMEYSFGYYINKLTSSGYDVFLINFNNPDKPIGFNSSLMKNFITDIIEEKEGNFESTYIGASMGGIIGRIALKELENSGYDHEFALYVSWDSPHKGANIPVGIQSLTMNITSLSPTIVSTAYATSILEDILAIDIPYIDLYQMLNSYAARQLLAQHWAGSVDYVWMQQQLEDLAYPNKLRKVAIANGSNTATQQEGVTQGEKCVNFSKSEHHQNWVQLWGYDIEIFAKYGKRRTALIASNIFGYGYIMSYLGVGSAFTLDLPYPYYFHNKVFDDAPGSNLINNIFSYESPPFTFVPVTSAIDIDKDIFNDGDFTYFNENGTHNTQYLIDNNLTPFDDIYSNSNNSFHVLDDDDIIKAILNDEIMYENMYLQDREINSNKNFEAEKTITAGKNVTYLTSDVAPSEIHTKHINQGNFIIKNGTKVNMYAGDEIILEPGFETEYGVEFTASIKNICNKKNKRNAVVSIPQIIGPYSFCEKTEYSIKCKNCYIEWHLLGENYDTISYYKTFTTPQHLPYGQYTLYCTKTTENGSVTVTKVIRTKCYKNKSSINNKDEHIVLEKNVNVFPNPANNSFNISLITQNKGNYTLTITNISGKEYYKETIQQKDTRFFNKEINISNFPAGIYFVNITGNNFSETEKLIVQ